MKTVIEMAAQAFETPGTETAFRNGFWTVTPEELERFAELVRADERKKWEGQTAVEINEAVLDERKHIVNLLMIQHEAAKGQHNYWHVAANLIEAEYGVHSDH